MASIKKQLPARARIDQLKKQAKELLAELRAGNEQAKARFASMHPASRGQLADAQLVVAREYGLASWAKLKARVLAIDLADPKTAFFEAACVPVDGSWHASGDLEKARAILAEHPEVLRGDDVWVAAVLGDAERVERLVENDRSLATATGGLYDWDALTYLCFSRYLRIEGGERFVRAARALLDAGASAKTGFYWQDHEPEATFEGVLYGAAAVAKHLELTRLLLERGADPNEDEVAYHVPEGYQNDILKALVETGQMDAGNLYTMLARKHDWHDYDGVVWLLDHGADPNYLSRWGRRALHQAIERDNPLKFFEASLDHGGDPTLPDKAGRSAIAVAARAGRADALELFAKRGFDVRLEGIDALLAACARADRDAARAMVENDHTLVAVVQRDAPSALADFAGAGNLAAVALLLDLGFDPAASRSCRAGAHFDTALHAAIWRARVAVAKLLVERGAPLDALNGHKETPLAYAVRACVHSEWPGQRSLEIVQTLLDAGAPRDGVKVPTGWQPLDDLLARGT